MIAQFLEIKAEYPGALLFYRMGDFYELFFDDAVLAAQALDITLTRRGKHLGKDIPMCGVPFHAAEGYLLNLIRKGFRVAVCEQLEKPKEAKKRGPKSVVKRGVVRLVTPGTLTEDSLLLPRQSNFLAAFAQVRDQSCLAWLDISTGDVRYSSCPVVRLGPEIARLAPAEVLISENTMPSLLEVITETGAAATPLVQSMFDSTIGLERLSSAFGVTKLDGFAGFSRAEIAALNALVEYITTTQKDQKPLLRQPVCEDQGDFVTIDAEECDLDCLKSLGKYMGKLKLLKIECAASTYYKIFNYLNSKSFIFLGIKNNKYINNEFSCGDAFFLNSKYKNFY